MEGLLLDNGYLTDLRTAVAGGIYAKHFALQELTAIGIVGTGVQAIYQLEVLRHITSCRKVILYGRTTENREKCKHKIEAIGYTVIHDRYTLYLCVFVWEMSFIYLPEYHFTYFNIELSVRNVGMQNFIVESCFDNIATT